MVKDDQVHREETLPTDRPEHGPPKAAWGCTRIYYGRVESYEKARTTDRESSADVGVGEFAGRHRDMAQVKVAG